MSIHVASILSPTLVAYIDKSFILYSLFGPTSKSSADADRSFSTMRRVKFHDRSALEKTLPLVMNEDSVVNPQKPQCSCCRQTMLELPGDEEDVPHYGCLSPTVLFMASPGTVAYLSLALQVRM